MARLVPQINIYNDLSEIVDDQFQFQFNSNLWLYLLDAGLDGEIRTILWNDMRMI